MTRDQLQHARDQWDAEADTFDEAPDHGLQDPAVRDAWRDLLSEALPPAPGRVADLGCGTGTLSLLLAELGYAVDGVDISPRMLQLAEEKTSADSAVRLHEGDAAEPPLEPGGYCAVVCRHVLWALPDPAAALRRWVDLLAPGGRLVLVEGSWHTGAGLTAARAVELLASAGREATVTPLDHPAYWGGEIEDERYLVVG